MTLDFCFFGDSEDMRRKITPLKAIRAFCIDCSGGSPSEVRNCIIPECPLYLYRLGKNPNRKGIGGNKVFVPKSCVEPMEIGKKGASND